MQNQHSNSPTRTKSYLFLVGFILINSISFGQTAFTASWPFTSSLLASSTGNVTASAATVTAGFGGSYSGVTTVQSNGFYKDTSILGKSASLCKPTYDSVGSTTAINPYINHQHIYQNCITYVSVRTSG